MPPHLSKGRIYTLPTYRKKRSMSLFPPAQTDLLYPVESNMCQKRSHEIVARSPPCETRKYLKNTTQYRYFPGERGILTICHISLYIIIPPSTDRFTEKSPVESFEWVKQPQRKVPCSLGNSDPQVLSTGYAWWSGNARLSTFPNRLLGAPSHRGVMLQGSDK